MTIDIIIISCLVIVIILLLITIRKTNIKSDNNFDIDIKQINKNLENLYNKALEQTGYVNSKIEEIGTLTKKMSNAMSTNISDMGEMGEVILENILQDCGMTKDRDYKTQFTDKNENGQIFRPDVVVFLPENRNIIIDSKFSFTVYNQYCNTDSAEEKQKLGKLLTKNIRDRINDLSNTKYHQIEELNTPDLIFMFLGIDDSLSVALKFDPDLVAYADKKRIALISPSILHISIKMVENLWRLDGQRESVIKVYDEAQKLVDKLGGFTEVMDSLGNSIAQSQKKYDDARNKLIDGKGSVSSRIQGLVSLGSKEAKKLSDD